MPELREHQRAAVDAAMTALSVRDRTQVVMACGTGKTLVGRVVADRVTGAQGLVGVLVPSLALLAQTLRAWREAGLGEFQALAVCSDDALAADGAAEDGADAPKRSRSPSPSEYESAEDFAQAAQVPVSTDSRQIAAWLTSADTGPGPRVVFATYQSVPRIAEAYRDVGAATPAFDLLVFDEAHRVAADPAAPFATALHDAHVPAAQRLFLTATPRVQVADPDTDDGAEVFVGMDDESLFGSRAYTLSVAEAIEDGLLSDYRVLVVGVTDAEVHKLVLDNAPLTLTDGAADVPAATLAAQVALAGAAAEFDLRRVLVFCGRVAASRRFADSLPHTIDALPADRRPTGQLTCGHVDGASTAEERDQMIESLRAPADGTWSVVSNVRVLGEGVDAPALDAVLFASPRSGQIDVVQSVGRAIRLHPERDAPAVILLPVYLAPGENDQAVLDDSAFRGVWQILRALRDHDSELGAQIVRARNAAASGEARPVLPERISVRLPEGADERFLAAFTAKVLDGAASTHQRGGMQRLLAFVEQFGHACPTMTYVDATGYRLGNWVGNRRRDFARGVLDPRTAAALEALPGWTWHKHRDQFEQSLTALHAYVQQHGALPTRSHVTADGLRLGQWVRAVRTRRNAGDLSEDRAARLEQVPGWTWTPAEDGWHRAYQALLAYAAEHGHCDVAARHVDADGLGLGYWVSNQRTYRSKLSAERLALLQAVPGWGWTFKQAYRNRMVAAVAAYHATHGPLPMPRDYATDADPTLGGWTARARVAHAAGRLDADTAALLEAIPDFSWAADTASDKSFAAGLAMLTAYVQQHGTADPPPSYRDADGNQPERFVTYCRALYAKGKMPEQRAALLQTLPGWTWRKSERAFKGTAAQNWAAGLAAVTAFAAAHGHTRIPFDHVDADGIPVAAWARSRRKEWQNGDLAPERAAALEAVDGWFWNRGDHLWAEGYAALRDYVAEHGTTSVPQRHVTADGRRLGAWVNAQRTDRHRGRLSDQRAAMLEALPGWAWRSTLRPSPRTATATAGPAASVLDAAHQQVRRRCDRRKGQAEPVPSRIQLSHVIERDGAHPESSQRMTGRLGREPQSGR